MLESNNSVSVFLRTKANANKCGGKDEKIVCQCNNEKTQQTAKDITKE